MQEKFVKVVQNNQSLALKLKQKDLKIAELKCKIKILKVCKPTNGKNGAKVYKPESMINEKKDAIN